MSSINLNFVVSVMSLSLFVVSCGNVKSQFRLSGGKTASESKAVSPSPLAAKPGDEIVLTGTEFKKSKIYAVEVTLADGSKVMVPLTIVSATEAKFTMPKGAGLGSKVIDLYSGDTKLSSFDLIADQVDNKLPIVIADASTICSDITYIDKNGKSSVGTKSCTSSGSSATTVADCTAGGQIGCKTTAAFIAAESANLTAANVKSGVVIGGITGSFSGAFSNCSADGVIGCITTASYLSADATLALAGNIRSGVTLAGTAGSVTAAPANCSSAGQQSCVATGTYFAGVACAANGSACYLPSYALTTQPLKAIDYDNIDANKASIRSSLALSGISGTLADCTTNGSQGCVTTASYKSADLTNLSAGNIKTGVTIAGQAGDFPSATYTLAGAGVTADLDSATFNAKIKSSSSFEYWDSTGARQTGAGDADITVSNIANTVDIFGATGTYTGTAPNVWDLRAGVTVSGVTGKLRVNCRSAANLATYDNAGYPFLVSVANGTEIITAASHGLTNNTTVRFYGTALPGNVSENTTYYVISANANDFQVSATLAGAAHNLTSNGTNVYVYKWGNGTTDIWDTLDDNGGYVTATPTYTGWSSNNLCGGIAASDTDDNVWKDVATNGDGSTASTCTLHPANCSFKDKITGLELAKADSTDRTWTASTQLCDNSTHNGKTDWRLPTQKELMDIYNHGFKATAGQTGWMISGDLNVDFWSSTTQSNDLLSAFSVHMGLGYTATSWKPASKRALCVRP
ncbi:MAG: DUF1566 domain-containing protein [Proteobacteria bacterium]|nr:DUF1566 domain-containing protein [Pseudomonadota bacterium]